MMPDSMPEVWTVAWWLSASDAEIEAAEIVDAYAWALRDEGDG